MKGNRLKGRKNQKLRDFIDYMQENSHKTYQNITQASNRILETANKSNLCEIMNNYHLDNYLDCYVRNFYLLF